MEPDDLLCSRNARPEKALVGRAQWKISQPPSLERNEQAWREHLYRSMRAVEGNLGHSLQERFSRLRKSCCGMRELRWPHVWNKSGLSGLFCCLTQRNETN